MSFSVKYFIYIEIWINSFYRFSTIATNLENGNFEPSKGNEVRELPESTRLESEQHIVPVCSINKGKQEPMTFSVLRPGLDTNHFF